MTRVHMSIENGIYTLSVQGHAEYNPGNDIVCSAISALSTTLACGIKNTEYTQEIEFYLKSGDILIKVKALSPEASARLDNLFECFLCGFVMIQNSYKDYVTVDGEISCDTM